MENVWSNHRLVAKPTDHPYMMEWVDAYDELDRVEFMDETSCRHVYEWVHEVPLNGQPHSIHVNFLRCFVMKTDKAGEEKILYQNSWVTDVGVSVENIKVLVRAGRCRWKSENELFNVMKNQGYYLERNDGHGQKNLAFNFYLLTLLAFLFHQIAELTDAQYQACRKKFGSKRHLWEKLRLGRSDYF